MAATPLTVTKAVTLASAAEADAALALVYEKPIYKTLAVVTESDSAQGLDQDKQLALTSANEANAAQVLAHDKRAVLGVAPESDTAQAVDSDKNVSLTAASETDSAQTLVKPIQKALTVAVETDAAQALDADRRLSLTPASEIGSAQALTEHKSTTLSTAVEAGLAQVLSISDLLVVNLGPALESNTAEALGIWDFVAAEADTAQAFTPYKPLSIGEALETDVPLEVFVRGLGLAVERDYAEAVFWVAGPARRLTVHKLATVQPAREEDLAETLTFAHVMNLTLTPATETDSAPSLTALSGARTYRVLVPAMEMD